MIVDSRFTSHHGVKAFDETKDGKVLVTSFPCRHLKGDCAWRFFATNAI